MPRVVKHHPALFSLAVALLIFPVILKISSVAAQSVSTVESADLEVALIRAGLDAEALAAAGIAVNEAARVVDDFETAMSSEPTRLADADAKYSSARVASDSLRRLIQSGRGDKADVAGYQQAMADLDAAEAAREAALDEWFAAATASLASSQTSTLRTIRGNRDWGLDLEMLTVDRTEAEWVELRDSLAHERVAAKYGEPCDAGVAAYLANCRSVPEVATAKTCCETNLSAVQAAWDTATE